jgi:hypothetical protein
MVNIASATRYLLVGHFDTVFLSDFANLSLRMGKNKQTYVSCNIAIFIAVEQNSPLLINAIIRLLFM